jgi:hypothetical protein
MTLKKMLAFFEMSSFLRGGVARKAKINSSYFFFFPFWGVGHPPKREKKKIAGISFLQLEF